MSACFVRRKTIVGLAIAFLLSFASSLTAQEINPPLLQAFTPAPAAPKRPAALVPLYAGFVGLQALDVHSTMRALDNGGREANPLIGGVMGTPAGLMALKAGSAAAVVLVSEKLWKRSPAAAVITMVALNSAYAMVAAHNYSITRRGP